jgi:EmrB/QacA subfamily drug resistance transporter
MSHATDIRQVSAEGPDPRRWLALPVIALAQLMVVLDATIVNIALPSAQHDLHITDANRQWVVTAYTLAFGGLLLLGGRIADYAGRKRTFLIGLIGFAAASAVGGAATDTAMLLSARAAQGAFGALLTPSALSLLAVMFTDPGERGKAFGVYGAIAGGGSAVGLVLGGVLTEYLNWRWCLYVNAPIAVIAAIGALLVLHNTKATGRARYDIPGVILATGGLVALVYGFTKAQTDGWRAHVTLGLIAAGVLLLLIFVVVEMRIKNPLLPLRIVASRHRGGAYLSVLLAVVGMFALFFFLNFYLQNIRHYSAVRTGLAFLPITGGVLFSSAICSKLLSHVQPRFLMGPGLLIAAGGMVLLTRLGVTTAYVSHVLPSLILVGVGLGGVMVPAISTATLGVRPQDTGVASAAVNTAQQIGGSLGTALLNTIAANATTHYLTTHPRTPLSVPNGAVHGYNIASAWGAGIMAAAGILALILVNAPRLRDSGSPVAEPLPQSPSVPDVPALNGSSATRAPMPSGGPALPQPNTAVAVAERPAPPRELAHVVAGTVAHGAGPVSDATLTLIDAAGRQIGRGSADPAGAYELTVPDRGHYVLIAHAPGYQPKAAALEVQNGRVTADIRLAGAAELVGLVSTPAGKSISGAAVTLTNAVGEVVAARRTDTDGSYEIADLQAGGYTLVVVAGTHTPAAIPVELSSSGKTRQDIQLACGAVLRGNIRAGAERRAVPGARVTLTDARGGVVASSDTDESGKYEFGEIPAGDYTLTASGYPPVTGPISIDGATEHDITLSYR